MAIKGPVGNGLCHCRQFINNALGRFGHIGHILHGDGHAGPLVGIVGKLGHLSQQVDEDAALDVFARTVATHNDRLARAAGELELRDAVRHLGNLLVHEDREVQEMAVWALGEIGGKDARRLLEDAGAEGATAAQAQDCTAKVGAMGPMSGGAAQWGLAMAGAIIRHLAFASPES